VPGSPIEPASPGGPDWVHDAVFYQIFPDRFANGDTRNDPSGTVPWGSAPTTTNFMGGDLEGVRQKLPYLQKLGVNALYFNPIFGSPSNHRYDTTDYEHVDRGLGGNVAFNRLTDDTKAAGIHVILDGVFNHTSHEHPWFEDVKEHGKQSVHWDKYDVRHWPIRQTVDDKGVLRSDDYKSWWGFASLPELHTEHDDVRNYFLRDKDAIVKRWMEDGRVDGWRMDVADEIEPEFWREARKQIKSANPNAYMVAENWHDASGMLQGDQFDGAMNYQHFRDPAVNYFAKKEIDTDSFVRRLKNNYPAAAQHSMFNVLDSHDTPRFITEAGGDWYRMRPAAMFQMTYVGAPVIYYGDEVGVQGGADPDSRRAFPWADIANPKDGTPQKQLLELYTKLVHTRTSEPVLRRGGFETLMTHNDNGLLAYRRWLPNDARDAVVALNNDVTEHPVTVPLASYAPDGTAYTDALSGSHYVVKNGAITIPEIEGNYGAVLLRDVREAKTTTAKISARARGELARGASAVRAPQPAARKR
jgi:glycosidase